MKDVLAPGAGSGRRQTVVALLLAALLLAASIWIYWPGISGPVLLDDRSSVLVIADLREQPELALDYLFGDRSGALGRSVSMASFVLEKLYLDQGVAGNKKVNIVLHALNGALVIWLLWLLFRHIEVPGYRLLSVLLGALWLLHPLLVSSVLYVVQRMAMLAAFFMLLSTISYVYWRLSLLAGRGGAWRFLPVPLFLVLGLFAKENAIVLVPTLLLLELLWFQCRGGDGAVIRWLQRLCSGLVIAGATGLLAFLLLGWDYLAGRFRNRPFSLDERLLTQARIVWDYLGQLVSPQVARMGLYHDDVIVSTSLTEPLSTLYALIAWLLLIAACAALLRWRGGRWLVLGVAWFLVGHGVESTVWPLEMYFEHRNYFPAIGLLLTLGALYALLLRVWPEPGPALLAWLGLVVLLLSVMTSSQVQVWSNRSLLIMHHLNAHPASARANIDMAVEFARLGEAGAAHEYSRRAFEASANKAAAAERRGDYQVRNLALSCIAGQPVPAAMIDSLGADDPEQPLSSVTMLLTFVRLLQDDSCPRIDRIRVADRLAELYLGDDRPRGPANMYSNLAVLENALQRFENAHAYAERFLALAPHNTQAMLMKLHFAVALRKEDEAATLVAALQKLGREGKLTVREQQTLALYLEN